MPIILNDAYEIRSNAKVTKLPLCGGGLLVHVGTSYRPRVMQAGLPPDAIKIVDDSYPEDWVLVAMHPTRLLLRKVRATGFIPPTLLALYWESQYWQLRESTKDST